MPGLSGLVEKLNGAREFPIPDDGAEENERTVQIQTERGGRVPPMKWTT